MVDSGRYRAWWIPADSEHGGFQQIPSMVDSGGFQHGGFRQLPSTVDSGGFRTWWMPAIDAVNLYRWQTIFTNKPF